jgi:hypothetical protein
MGVFAQMMEGLASEGGEDKVVMIDAMVLSRFGAGPLIVQCAAKEMNHGHSKDG